MDMGKLSNLLNMMEYLSTGRKYSIEELSNLLEVSPRMVRFYKEELEKAGIYVDTLHGPYGGYVLKHSIHLPERKISKIDLSYLEKIASTLEGEEREKMMIVIDKLRGTLLSSGNEKVELSENILPIYNILSRAIKEKRKVLITYLSKEKPVSTRVIHPYQIFLLKDGWAVAAFCEKKQDLRHFEFSRITHIELLEDFYQSENSDEILPH